MLRFSHKSTDDDRRQNVQAMSLALRLLSLAAFSAIFLDGLIAAEIAGLPEWLSTAARWVSGSSLPHLRPTDAVWHTGLRAGAPRHPFCASAVVLRCQPMRRDQCAPLIGDHQARYAAGRVPAYRTVWMRCTSSLSHSRMRLHPCLPPNRRWQRLLCMRWHAIIHDIVPFRCLCRCWSAVRASRSTSIGPVT